MEKELEKTSTRVTFVVPSRADLRWVTRSPSTESRTRTSLNFGKTNIVSQFVFHSIFVLLLLLCRLSVYIVISSRYLQFDLKLEIERSKFRAVPLKSCIPNTSGIDHSDRLFCRTRAYRTSPVYLPHTSGISCLC